MVRTPRWVATYKTKVTALLLEGKSYREIAEALDIEESKVIYCEMSANNYHISYDSTPDDWVTPEFVYDFDEHKATLLSPELLQEIRSLSDAEMKMLLQYVEGAPISEEEKEWAADKFYELQGIAHGLSGQVSTGTFPD
jgi:hypothetical protein